MKPLDDYYITQVFPENMIAVPELEIDDRVLEINSTPITKKTPSQTLTTLLKNRDMDLLVQRGSEKLEIKITDNENHVEGRFLPRFELSGTKAVSASRLDIITDHFLNIFHRNDYVVGSGNYLTSDTPTTPEIIARRIFYSSLTVLILFGIVFVVKKK